MSSPNPVDSEICWSPPHQSDNNIDSICVSQTLERDTVYISLKGNEDRCTKDETLFVIKNEIMDANQYWNSCNNIEHMQSIFRDCIEWDVTLLSKSKNKRV